MSSAAVSALDSISKYRTGTGHVCIDDASTLSGPTSDYASSTYLTRSAPRGVLVATNNQRYGIVGQPATIEDAEDFIRKHQSKWEMDRSELVREVMDKVSRNVERRYDALRSTQDNLRSEQTGMKSQLEEIRAELRKMKLDHEDAVQTKIIVPNSSVQSDKSPTTVHFLELELTAANAKLSEESSRLEQAQQRIIEIRKSNLRELTNWRNVVSQYQTKAEEAEQREEKILKELEEMKAKVGRRKSSDAEWLFQKEILDLKAKVDQAEQKQLQAEKKCEIENDLSKKYAAKVKRLEAQILAEKREAEKEFARATSASETNSTSAESSVQSKNFELEAQKLRLKLDKMKKRYESVYNGLLAKYNDATKDLQTAQNEKKVIDDKVSALQVQLKEEQAFLISLQRKEKSTSQALREAQAELKKLKQEQKNQKKGSTLDHSSCEQQSTDLRTEIKCLQQKLAAKGTHDDAALKQVYEEKIARLQQSFEKEKTKGLEDKKLMSTLSKREAEATEQLHEAEKKLEQVKQQYEKELRRKDEHDTCQLKIGELQDEVKRLLSQQNNGSQEEALSRLKKEISALKGKLHEETVMSSNLRQKESKASHLLLKTQKELERVKKAHQDETRETNAHTACLLQAKDLQREIDRLKAALQAEKEADSDSNEVEQLQQKLKESNNDVCRKESELERERLKAEQLLQQVKELKTRNETIEGALHEKENLILSMIDEREEMQERVLSAKASEVQAEDSKCAVMANTIKTLENVLHEERQANSEQVRKFEQDTKQWKAKESQALDRLNSTNNALLKANEELKERDKRIAELEEKCRSKDNNNTSTNQEIDRLHQQIKQLHLDLANKDKQIKKTKSERDSEREEFEQELKSVQDVAMSKLECNQQLLVEKDGELQALNDKIRILNQEMLIIREESEVRTDELNAEVRRLTALTDDMREDLVRVEQERNEVVKGDKKNDEQLKEALEKVAEYEGLVAKTEMKKASMERNLKGEIQALKEEIQGLKRQLSVAQEEGGKQVEKVSDMSKTLNETSEQLNSIKKQLEDAQAELQSKGESQDSRVAELEAELHNASQKAESIAKTQQQKLDSLNQEIEKLQKQLEKQSTESSKVVDLTEELQCVKENLEEKCAELQKMSKTVREANEQHKTLEQTISELKSCKSDHKTTVDKQLKELCQLKSKIEEMEEQEQSSRDYQESLQQSIKKLKADLKAKGNEASDYAQAKKAKDKLETDAQEMRKQIDQLKSELGNKDNKQAQEVVELEKQVQQLQIELQAKQDELSTLAELQEKNADLEQLAEELQLQLDERDEEDDEVVKKLKQRKDAAEKEANTLIAKLNDRDEKIDEQEDKIKELEDSVFDARKEAERVQYELDDLRQEHEQANNANLAKLHARIEELEEQLADAEGCIKILRNGVPEKSPARSASEASFTSEFESENEEPTSKPTKNTSVSKKPSAVQAPVKADDNSWDSDSDDDTKANTQKSTTTYQDKSISKRPQSAKINNITPQKAKPSPTTGQQKSQSKGTKKVDKDADNSWDEDSDFEIDAPTPKTAAATKVPATDNKSLKRTDSQLIREELALLDNGNKPSDGKLSATSSQLINEEMALLDGNTASNKTSLSCGSKNVEKNRSVSPTTSQLIDEEMAEMTSGTSTKKSSTGKTLSPTASQLIAQEMAAMDGTATTYTDKSKGMPKETKKAAKKDPLRTSSSTLVAQELARMNGEDIGDEKIDGNNSWDEDSDDEGEGSPIALKTTKPWERVAQQNQTSSSKSTDKKKTTKALSDSKSDSWDSSDEDSDDGQKSKPSLVQMMKKRTSKTKSAATKTSSSNISPANRLTTRRSRPEDFGLSLSDDSEDEADKKKPPVQTTTPPKPTARERKGLPLRPAQLYQGESDDEIEQNQTKQDTASKKLPPITSKKPTQQEVKPASKSTPSAKKSTTRFSSGNSKCNMMAEFGDEIVELSSGEPSAESDNNIDDDADDFLRELDEIDSKFNAKTNKRGKR